MAARWTIVVPVKETAVGKSRLSAFGADRPSLALAMALDTIDAVVGSARVSDVIVVSSDRSLVAALGALAREGSGVARVQVLPDGGTGLDGALRSGIALASRTTSYVAALTADLPGLRADDVDDVLGVAEQHRLGVVADADGTGTTLLTATEPAALDPQFGERSLAAHRAQGAVLLDAAPTLRRDVDVPAHLVELGAALGVRTASIVARRAVP
ncbi:MULTISPECIES: 2-phospho-L-lactate guanylyltransferase [Mumia]|uniref:2-phospho-L-lactate guanylyltransferase n=1 Tax=Mumia xiangluensis TaxID=1678900 RepID=A0ABW1QM54_9ACTN|nr:MULTISPECIES: 2-phospho-L-lactate guanylyltransferase [Mumia]